MKVLVSDSSVLIDLLRYRIIRQLAKLPYEFVVPDLTLETELLEDRDQAVELIRVLARIESLSEEEMTTLLQFRETYPQLSVPDCAALSIVETRGWTLLAGDRLMREVAKERGLDVRGTLWIVDEYQQSNLIDDDILLDVLNQMLTDPRIRLPKVELKKRIRRLITE